MSSAFMKNSFGMLHSRTVNMVWIWQAPMLGPCVGHFKKLFIYWWQELALYMKCVIGSMFHWINGVSRGKMKFREEKWIWLIFPHETPFFLCETSFFRTKIHLSNEARNFDSLSLTETAFTKLKLYTVAQFIYQCLARPGSLTCWTSRVFIRYPVDSR